jgi:deoxycytidine triphosphate deaminase
MLLNDKQIQEYLEQGYLVQNPEYEKVNWNNNLSYGLSTSGYDIRLGNIFTTTVPFYDAAYVKQGLGIVDLSEHNLSQDERFGNFYYDTTELKENEKFILKPDQFICASSEEFVMPDDVVGVVYNKSTLARLGINVMTTVIEANWEGNLLVEIKNYGRLDFALMQDMPIAQVMFYKIETPKNPYNGKYQGQKAGTMALGVNNGN